MRAPTFRRARGDHAVVEAPARDDARRFGSAPSRRLAEATPAPASPARRRARRDVRVQLVLLAGDALALAIALGLLAWRKPQDIELLPWVFLTLPAWIVLFRAYGLYGRELTRIGHSTIDDIPRLFHAVLVGCTALGLAILLFSGADPHITVLFGFGTVAATGVFVARASLRRVVASVFPERVLLVGDAQSVDLLARKISAHLEYGIKPVGVLTEGWRAQGSVVNGLAVLGALRETDVAKLLEDQRVDRVIVAQHELEPASLRDLLQTCRSLAVRVSLLPTHCDVVGAGAEVGDIEGLTLIHVSRASLLLTPSRRVKRVFDTLGAALGMIALAPAMGIIAAAIKLDSPGPVMFRQRRVGKDGQPFSLVKYRTMVIDAEARRAALLRQSRDPNWLLLDHDPRITRVGRFLRMTSLDELPQLWNVLKGEMSLVGPRPLVESEQLLVPEWGRSRLEVPPGLTGLWQVLGRTSISFEEMIKLDCQYVSSWSLWRDVTLVLRTAAVVVTRRGAN